MNQNSLPVELNLSVTEIKELSIDFGGTMDFCGRKQWFIIQHILHLPLLPVMWINLFFSDKLFFF